MYGCMYRFCLFVLFFVVVFFWGGGGGGGCFFLSFTDFSQSYLFKNLFQEYEQSQTGWIQIRPAVCWALFGSKLFAKIISRLYLNKMSFQPTSLTICFSAQQER